nr:hypothetical protein [Tanacetum cinerariifolium]
PNEEIFTELARIRVDTPLFEGMLVEHQATDDTANITADDVDDVVAEDVVEPTPPSPIPTTTPPPPQALPFTSQEVREEKEVKSVWVEKINKADIDVDEDVILEEVDVAKDAKVAEDADVQGSLEESQAQVYHIDLERA